MTKPSKTATGCNMWLYTPVAVGDHPKNMSYQRCSPSFLTLSSILCISFVSWWTVIKAFYPFSCESKIGGMGEKIA